MTDGDPNPPRDDWAELLAGDAPLHLLLLSGAQLMPNLQSVLIAMTSGRLASIHIACTGNEKLSQKPAQALRKLIEGLDPATFGASARPRVEIATIKGDGTDPRSVHDWAERLVQRHPDDRWLCNITGALKPMSFGLRDFLRTAERERIDARGLYVELQNGWSRVSVRDGDPVHTPMQPPFRNELVDKVPILDLIQANVEYDVSLGKPASVPPDLDIEALTEALVDARWQWHPVYETFGIWLSQTGDGFCFEVWVKLLCDALGARNTLGNVEVSSSARTPLSESDVVCLHNGKLTLLDLKLTTEDDDKDASPSDQVRSATQTARTLGGLSASILLLRPSWPHTDDPSSLAIDAMAEKLGVSRLSSRECDTLATRLHSALKLPEDTSGLAERIDGLLGASRQRHGYAISTPRNKKSGKQLPVANEPADAVSAIEIDAVILEAQPCADPQLSRNWQHIRLCGTSMLYVRKPAKDASPVKPLKEFVPDLDEAFRVIQRGSGILLFSKRDDSTIKTLCERLEHESIHHLGLPAPPQQQAVQRAKKKPRAQHGKNRKPKHSAPQPKTATLGAANPQLAALKGKTNA